MFETCLRLNKLRTKIFILVAPPLKLFLYDFFSSAFRYFIRNVFWELQIPLLPGFGYGLERFYRNFVLHQYLLIMGSF